jgi:hypothetical protein
MDISRLFIRYRIPDRFFYLGDDYIELYRIQNQQKVGKKDFERISGFNFKSDQFGELLNSIPKKSEAGVILNSSHFIFNILEFDRIPWREHLIKELVEWKIKKVFPEDIEQYENHFFQLDRKRILSILFRKDLRENIEQVFIDHQRHLTYFGNSTIEIMNRIFRGRQIPDFFLEVDENFCIMVFQHRSIPFYIRKFRIEKEEEMIGELKKTLKFVASNYLREPTGFTLISHDDEQRSRMGTELEKLGLKDMKTNSGVKLYFPK